MICRSLYLPLQLQQASITQLQQATQCMFSELFNHTLTSSTDVVQMRSKQGLISWQKYGEAEKFR